MTCMTDKYCWVGGIRIFEALTNSVIIKNLEQLTAKEKNSIINFYCNNFYFLTFVLNIYSTRLKIR